MPRQHSRIGLTLFAVYLIVYAGFVLLNAFVPDSMRHMPIPGVNLAIVYGFTLILSAFGLAVVYGLFGGPAGETRPAAKTGETGSTETGFSWRDPTGSPTRQEDRP